MATTPYASSVPCTCFATIPIANAAPSARFAAGVAGWRLKPARAFETQFLGDSLKTVHWTVFFTLARVAKNRKVCSAGRLPALHYKIIFS